MTYMHEYHVYLCITSSSLYSIYILLYIPYYTTIIVHQQAYTRLSKDKSQSSARRAYYTPQEV